MRDQLNNVKPQQSQISSPIIKIRESEIIEDSSATEDNTDEKPKKFIEYGFIQLFIKYDTTKLVVKVIGGKNLINTDSCDKSDPYARILLLPDRKKRTKRKTKVIKNSQDPQWDEQFEFHDLNIEGVKTKTLDVVIKNDHFILNRERNFMGKCMIQLDKVIELENGNTNWYRLKCKQFFKEQEKHLYD